MDYFQTFHQFLATSWLAVLYVNIALGTLAHVLNETEWPSARPGVRFSRARTVFVGLSTFLVLCIVALLWPVVLVVYFIEEVM